MNQKMTKGGADGGCFLNINPAYLELAISAESVAAAESNSGQRVMLRYLHN